MNFSHKFEKEGIEVKQKKKQCFGCGEFGHLVAHCGENDTANSESAGAVVEVTQNTAEATPSGEAITQNTADEKAAGDAVTHNTADEKPAVAVAQTVVAAGAPAVKESTQNTTGAPAAKESKQSTGDPQKAVIMPSTADTLIKNPEILTGPASNIRITVHENQKSMNTVDDTQFKYNKNPWTNDPVLDFARDLDSTAFPYFFPASIENNSMEKTRKEQDKKTLGAASDLFKKQIKNAQRLYSKKQPVNFRSNKVIETKISAIKATLRIFCTYCKENGHKITECQKKINDSAQSSLNTTLNAASQHSQPSTTKRESYPKGIIESTLQRIVCNYCQEKGHVSTECQKKINEGAKITPITTSSAASHPNKKKREYYPSGIPLSFLVNREAPGNIMQDDTANRIFWPGNMPWAPIPQAQANIAPTSEFQYPQNPYIPAEQAPIFINPSNTEGIPQAYSPSDAYTDAGANVNQEAPREGSESPDMLQAGEKRLSAFQRLGPLSQPKKPKLTINLLCNKEQSVREVVDETEVTSSYVPVHLREDILNSDNEIVMKFLKQWPWMKKVVVRKSVTVRPSKSVMLLEQEKMEKIYEKDSWLFLVSVTGYPPSWKKEDVLDAVLESVKGKSFIPCFTEFTPSECKFFVLRNYSGLIAIHKYGFVIRVADVELTLTISHTDLSINQIDFIPRLVLRKHLSSQYDGERKLSLKEFTLQPDISHFIYFPLSRTTNQLELVQLQTTIAWEYLTDLDLSCNKLTSINNFELPSRTPRLQHLDLSKNLLDGSRLLLPCRELSLKSIKLEGNPLCHDYIDPTHYVKVMRMMFPMLVEIDGIPIKHQGDFPPFKKNYCPHDARFVVDKFLEVFFPLLDSPSEDRVLMEDLYDQDATLTVTFRQKLRYSPAHKNFRNLFLRSRIIEEGDMDAIEGAGSIIKLLTKWPSLEHDPYTFTADVFYHDDTATVLRISGVLKVTAESLAQDEHMLAFTRTVVLRTLDGMSYKIHNEMLYWDSVTAEYGNKAFQVNRVKSKRLNLKLESNPDEDLKSKLIEIFMSITGTEEKASEKCLETKNWHMKEALEYFMKVLKLDGLESLRHQLQNTLP